MALIGKLATSSGTFVSVELTAPKNQTVLDQLKCDIDLLNQVQPLFCSVAMHDINACVQNDSMCSLNFAGFLVRQLCCPVVLHLTCEAHSHHDYDTILNRAFALGITNVLVVRGDSYDRLCHDEPNKPAFANVNDLLKYIKTNYSNQFCIGVPVFPAYGQSAQTVQMLNDKIANGAQFAITQVLSTFEEYDLLMKHLADNHINIPVFAGLMPVTNGRQYHVLKSFGKCSMAVAKEQQISACLDNDDKIAEISVQANLDIVHQCLQNNYRLFHIFTLNKVKVSMKIIESAKHTLPN